MTTPAAAITPELHRRETAVCASRQSATFTNLKLWTQRPRCVVVPVSQRQEPCTCTVVGPVTVYRAPHDALACTPLVPVVFEEIRMTRRSVRGTAAPAVTSKIRASMIALETAAPRTANLGRRQPARRCLL